MKRTGSVNWFLERREELHRLAASYNNFDDKQEIKLKIKTHLL
jgi:hypothetical protein